MSGSSSLRGSTSTTTLSIAAANFGGTWSNASATSSSKRCGDISTAIGDLLGRVLRGFVLRRHIVDRIVGLAVGLLLRFGRRLGAGLGGRRRARLGLRLFLDQLLAFLLGGGDAAFHRGEAGLVLQQRADLAVHQA